MAHILMVVANDIVHDPRVLKEARALKDAGHAPSFIGWDRSGRLPRESTVDGIPVRLVRTEGTMRLFWKDLFRNPLWWRRAARLASRDAFDIVHCHDLDALPVGVRLKRATGKPLVYDCHEVFHRMIEREVPRFVTRYVARLEADLVPRADRIVVVSAVVQDYIREISGRDSLVVGNYPDFVVDAYAPPPPGPFTVAYLGNLHPSRFILPAIDVVGGMPDARLVIAGSQKLVAEVEARCARYPNTRFLGQLPNDQVLPFLRDAHAVLSMFDPTLWTNAMGLPNKVFEAMAAGRPSIVTENVLISEIVRREDCGLAVPYSEAGFRSALATLMGEAGAAERMGRNGLAAARREYTWAKEKAKLLRLYDELAPL